MSVPQVIDASASTSTKLSNRDAVLVETPKSSHLVRREEPVAALEPTRTARNSSGGSEKGKPVATDWQVGKGKVSGT